MQLRASSISRVSRWSCRLELVCDDDVRARRARREDIELHGIRRTRRVVAAHQFHDGVEVDIFVMGDGGRLGGGVNSGSAKRAAICNRPATDAATTVLL